MPENTPSHPAEKTDDMQPPLEHIQEAEVKEKATASSVRANPLLLHRPATPIPSPRRKKQNGSGRILLIGAMLVIGGCLLLLGGLYAVYYKITQYLIDEGVGLILSYVTIVFPLFAIGGIVFVWGLIRLVKQMPRRLGLIASLIGIGLIIGLPLLGGEIAPTPLFLGPYPLVTHQGYLFSGQLRGMPAVAWSPDGKRIASAANGGTVEVWNVINGGNVIEYWGHSDDVLAVAWSPDGKRIASGGWGKTVQVWDATTGVILFTYQGHSSRVNAVAWSPDGKRIASASGYRNGESSDDTTVQVWNAIDGGNVFTYRGHSDDVLAVAWSPDGKRIASGSFDGTVQVWNAIDGGNVFIYRGHSSRVYAVAWSPDSKRIASGASNVQVWNAVDGTLVFTYQGRTVFMDAVAWSPDGKRIACADDYSGDVKVLDATSGVIISSYNRYYKGANALVWSPDGKRIAVGYEDGTVRIWDAS